MSEDLPDLEPIDLSTWPPGWYADHWSPGQYRFWNGERWTDAVHRPDAAASPTMPGTAQSTTATPHLPPGRNPRGPRTAAVVAGLVVLVLLAGAVGYAIQSSRESSDSANGTRVPATTAPGPATPAPGAADRAALSSLVVGQADVGSSSVVVLIPDGNRTTEPTLDLCNGTFPSEKLRAARLQVAELDGQGSVLLSTEAVTYRNVAATAAAFADLRKVSASCPHEPVPSPVGQETAETEFHAPPDRTWSRTPSVERLAYSFDTTSTGTTKTTRSSVAVYLRRGRALLGLYFPQPNGPQPAVDGKTSIEGIVTRFEARMARLPAKVVGGSPSRD